MHTYCSVTINVELVGNCAWISFNRKVDKTEKLRWNKPLKFLAKKVYWNENQQLYVNLFLIFNIQTNEMYIMLQVNFWYSMTKIVY